ncbi:MAG: molybdenum cofactor guanylyltransferase [Acidobacteria bacterium]|nr:molybdenum cofactor guanylyltransferase [Acidobacteriota bacterium]
MRRSDITGYVLAGGSSRRMGTDKALIPWGSGTLLSHALSVLQDVVTEVFVVSSNFGHHAALPDAVPGQGPLGGISTALSRSATDWNLVFAVDLPLVDAQWFRWLADVCDRTASDAVLARIQGRLQPLCAAYHRRLLPAFDAALKNGELSIHRLLESPGRGKMDAHKRIEIIDEPQLITKGFSQQMFANVNTPEDLAKVKRLAQVSHGNDD